MADNLEEKKSGRAGSGSAGEEYPAPKITKARIYTMPEKFYVEERGGGERKNTFLIVAIVILVLALLGGGAYLIIQKTNQNTNTETNINSVVSVGNENDNADAANNNVNANANTNTNVNTSANVNTQVNQNIDVSNINLFTNANTNTQPALNTNTTVAGSQDTDKDGLTDIEESLFGTSLSLADTDSDGYTDGQEIVSGYNPNGAGQLENSSKVRTYNDTTNNYNLLYPAAWAVADDPLITNGKIFTSGEEFISLNIQGNPERLSARDWYLANSPGVNSSQVTIINNWAKTLVGALSLDGLTAYYARADKVYVVSYNINTLSEAGYQSTFEMMYKSFAIGSSGTSTNTNSVINLNTYSGNTNTYTNYNSNVNTNTNTNTNTNVNSNTNTNFNINLGNRL